MLKYFAVLTLQLAVLFSYAQPQDSGEIPFTMVKNTIILELSIEGNPHRFLLDTGGGFMISEELAQRYGFPVQSSIEVGDVNRQELQLNRVNVPEIALGEWTFRNRLAVVYPGWGDFPNSCFALDGMIGRDFFTGAILHFDYQAGILRLTQDASVVSLVEADATPLRINERGLPEALIRINGAGKFILFDSGSGDLYSPKTSKAKRLPQELHLTFEGIFSFGLSKGKIKSSERYATLVDELIVGGGQFNNFHSQFSKLTSARLGAALLYYGQVTLDYGNQKFYFSPYTDAPEPQRLQSFGVGFTSLDGRYIVKWVLEDSPAEKAGLRFGQTVLQINDLSLETNQDNCNYYLNGFGLEEVEELRLRVINRRGQEEEILLKKEGY